MDTDVIVIPVKAMSFNQYYTYYTGNPRVKKSGHAWKSEVQKYLKGRKKVLGKVRVHYGLYFKDRRKHDWDNCMKPLNDAIKNVIIEDDDMIEEATVQCKKAVGKNYICLKVESLEPEKNVEKATEIITID